MAKLSIGYEIEVNQHPNYIPNSWKVDTEHCGSELKTSPLKSPKAILGALRDIREIQNNSDSVYSFHNAGTHIHIDFLSHRVDDKRLERKLSKLIVPGFYQSPTGSNKKYFWLDTSGNTWDSPAKFHKEMAAAKSGTEAFYQRDGFISESVKRFCIIGVKFWHVLMLLQHPDRYFNKYCHSLGDWNLNKLDSCRSVSDIVGHPNLVQSHRRHAINPMAISKYGTIEIRMIKASLSANEIWIQTFFFGKMAGLAKRLTAPIPEPTNNPMKDLENLMDAMRIHGKMRNNLKTILQTRPTKNFNAICHRCHEQFKISRFVDVGLSRAQCSNCRQESCARCGARTMTNSINSLGIGPDGYHRILCRVCLPIRDVFLKTESERNILTVDALAIGSGHNGSNFTRLLKIKELLNGY